MLAKKNNVIYTLFFFLATVVIQIVIFNISEYNYNSLNILGNLCLTELIIFLFVNAIISRKIISFSSLFIMILFLFHFGQLMIYAYFRSIYSHVRFLLLLNLPNAIHGFKLINLVFLSICWGILLGELKDNSNYFPQEHQIMNQKFDWKHVSKIIIATTFPVKMFIDMRCLIVSIAQGGRAARAWINTFPNILLYYGKISLIGFGLLLFVMKDEPKKQRNLFLFIESYVLIMMVSGIRSENVGYLLVFLFLYFFMRKENLHIPTVILYSVIGFWVLTFVVTAGTFRGLENKNIETFFETFYDAFTEKNVILSMFDTCGDTGYTAQCVINKWLPTHEPSYGDAYWLGWTAVIPNIPVVFTLPGKITESSCFALKLQRAGALSSSYTNIGGSIIGELFFNFGYWGSALAAVFMGLLIGWISRKSHYYLENNNYYGIIKFFPMMFASIYWVRDYFGGGFREVVWGPFFCWILLTSFIKPLNITNQQSTRRLKPQRRH